MDEKSKADADLFFRRFAASVAEQLELPDSVDELWDSGFSNPQNCTRYVERQILQPLGAPCVIAIDETDSVFRTAFSADFFAMLRSWHGLRAHPIRRSWKNLDIILSTSTEPQFFIDRPHESPFNVGVVLPLDDFLLGAGRAPQRATSTAARRRRRPAPVRAGRRASLPDAQGAATWRPATRRRLPSTSSSRRRPRMHGPFGDHLRYYLLRLQGKPDLISGAAPDDRAAHRRPTSC